MLLSWELFLTREQIVYICCVVSFKLLDTVKQASLRISNIYI